MNKNVILGIVVVLVVIMVGGGIVLSKKTPKETMNESVDYTPVDTATTTNATTTATTTAIRATPSEGVFTQADVAQHSTEADCYASINGKVYNLTAWINQHPGGDRAILSICGTDGSAAFNAQHGKGGLRFETILNGFEIGVLAQ